MQFTDSKSQQQNPLVAFLATTVLVISGFLFHFRVVKQSYLKPKASFVKAKVISHFVCKNHKFKQRTNEAKTEESKCDRSVRVRTVSY